MLNPATPVMTFLPLWIIALHMLGDYVLQTHDTATYKYGCWKTRTIHVSYYTFPFAILSILLGGGNEWVFPLMVFIPHWIIDSHKWCPGHPWALKGLLVDQTLHLLCLALAATICYG